MPRLTQKDLDVGLELAEHALRLTQPETAKRLEKVFADDREIRRLEREIEALEAKHEAARRKQYKREDAAIAAEAEVEEAAAAELARRERDEPRGSLAHAARAAKAAGLDHLSAPLFDGLSADALRDLKREHRELYDSSLAAFGTAAMKARMDA